MVHRAWRVVRGASCSVRGARRTGPNAQRTMHGHDRSAHAAYALISAAMRSAASRGLDAARIGRPTTR